MDWTRHPPNILRAGRSEQPLARRGQRRRQTAFGHEQPYIDVSGSGPVAVLDLGSRPRPLRGAVTAQLRKEWMWSVTSTLRLHGGDALINLVIGQA